MREQFGLTPESQEIIEEWVEALKGIKERHPILSQVDLVVEGGLGNGKTMPHIARSLFPDAVYVATDIYERLVPGKRRLRRKVDEETVGSVVQANEGSFDLGQAIIHANCFDEALILDLAQKTNSEHPLLVSFNCLFALLDRRKNRWERKRDNDIYSASRIIRESPYVGQLHIINSYPWEEEQTSHITCFYYLEAIAQDDGWTTERLNNGLLMVRSDSL